MLYVSISRTDAAPTPIATAVSRILLARRTRSDSHTRLESSTPAMARFSCGMMTAHATTGPARGPRPTSSTPASSGPCVARNWRSMPLHRFLPSAMPETMSSRAPRQRFSSALGRGCFGNRDANLLLANARGLAGERTQVEELRPADTPAAHDCDLGDHRTVDREDALDTNTVGNLADRERRAHSGAATGDANALKGLQTFLVAFAHAHADTERVAGAEWRDFLHPLLLGFDKRVHGGNPVESTLVGDRLK